MRINGCVRAAKSLIGYSLTNMMLFKCDNVWIGAKVSFFSDVTIGEGAVVGACAVVAKSVPAWSVVVGNPAKVVGNRGLKDD